MEMQGRCRGYIGEIWEGRLGGQVRDVREAVPHEEGAEELGVAYVALQHLARARVGDRRCGAGWGRG